MLSHLIRLSLLTLGMLCVLSGPALALNPLCSGGGHGTTICPDPAGDVSGPYSGIVVTRIQGTPVSAVAPLAGQFLQLIAGVWTPITFTALGDVTGNFPNFTVARIRGFNVSAVAPLNNQALVWNAGTTQYEPQNIVLSGGIGSTTTTAIADTAIGACQAVRRVVATGHVQLATGGALTDGDHVIGIAISPVAIGGQASIAKTGSTIPCVGLANGRLYRNPATGNLVAWVSIASGQYTQLMVVSSSSGAQTDVVLGDIEQVP